MEVDPKQTAQAAHYRRHSPARQCAAPHCGLHKCFNQALQLGDFRPPSLQSGPGAKRLPSLHQDEGLVGTQRFHTNEELMDVVNKWLHNLAVPFFEEGLQKLVSQYDKCLNVDGNYVEQVMQLYM